MYMYLRGLAGLGIMILIGSDVLFIFSSMYVWSAMCIPDNDCVELVKLAFRMKSEYNW